MSDPINSISSSGITSSGVPHIQRRNTPYPSLEYPTLFPQWKTPHQVFKHWIEIMTDTSTPPPQQHPHKITLRFYQNHWLPNHTPTLPKSHSDFTKITLRLYQNHTPTIPKSQSDFTKITVRLYQITLRLHQNHSPTLPKSHSDFTKITVRLYQNHTPTLPKSNPDFA